MPTPQLELNPSLSVAVMKTVLMVAEKPSIAESISSILSKKQAHSRRGIGTTVHEFDGTFRKEICHYKVTSVTGHVYAIDFTAAHQSWQTDQELLFDAPTRRNEANPKAHMQKHLQVESKKCDYLVLWLDCDREGENICFEVIENCVGNLTKPVSGQKNVFRAKFSAITAVDINRALNNLVDPNENESNAVAARQELDLKIGVAFTRFQTQFFSERYGNLDATLISYGPCQTPTLGFTVNRHDEILSHVPQPFFSLKLSVEAEGRALEASWEKGREFVRTKAESLLEELKNFHYAKVLSVSKKEESRPQKFPVRSEVRGRSSA